MCLLIGNPTDTTVETTEEESTQEVSEDSKTSYINDSFDLDTIPFTVEQIIDTDNNEDYH
jgi:hypothetical protein